MADDDCEFPEEPNPDDEEALSIDPVNVINGAVVYSEQDVRIDCAEVPLVFKRTYNSHYPLPGHLGAGWTHSLNWRLISTNRVEGAETNAFRLLATGGGDLIWFKDNATNGFRAPPASRWTLVQVTSGCYVVRDPRGVSVVFDTNGTATSITGPFGSAVTLSYTNAVPDQRLVRAAHSSGAALQFHYASNMLARVDSPVSNHFVAFSYVGGRVEAMLTDGVAVHTSRYFYGSAGCVTQVVDRSEWRYRYAYAANSVTGLPPRAVFVSADSNIVSHSLAYAPSNRPETAVTYYRGDIDLTSIYSYDPIMRTVEGISGPDSNEVATRTVDGLGFVRDNVWSNKQTGRVLRHVYTRDEQDRIASVGVGYGVVPTNLWQFQWDTNFPVVTSASDPEGSSRVWTYTNGLVTAASWVLPSNEMLVTSYAYASNGLLVAKTNANGHWVRYQYDALGRPTSVTPQAGPCLQASWDGLNHLASIRLLGGGDPPRALDRSIAITSDAGGRVRHVTWPDQLSESWAYDGNGNLTNWVDRAGGEHRYAWLPMGRLSSASRGTGGDRVTVRLQYDQQLNLRAVHDEEGRCVEAYGLDRQNRPTSVTNLESQVMTIDWAVAQMPSRVVRFDGSAVSLDYDEGSRLSILAFPNETVSLRYYRNDLPMSASNRWGTVSNTYDKANRLIAEATPAPSSLVEYVRYPAGQVSNVTSVIGSIAYQLDGADRVTNVVSGLAGLGTKVFGLTYDDSNGLLASMRYPNGVACAYAYDQMDHLTSVVWSGESGQVLRRRVYTRNARGLVTNMVEETGEETRFGYDGLERLTREERAVEGGPCSWLETYEYDLAGNRTAKTVLVGATDTVARLRYGYGSGNRLSAWSVAGETHVVRMNVVGDSSEPVGTDDRFGQLWVSNQVPIVPSFSGTNFWACNVSVGLGTQRVVAAIRDQAGNVGYATSVVFATMVTNGAYEYNDAGCMTSVVYGGQAFGRNLALAWDDQYHMSGVSIDGAKVERYGYDAYGRRLWMSDGSTTNWLVYDGWQVAAEVDADGRLVRSYVYGPGIDNVLAMTVYASVTNTYYYLKDHLGSVLALVDESGSVVESYSYDAWGRVTTRGPANEILTESKVGNTILFQGREYSWKTGLYYFRARWYEPVTGRFLSRDPIGIAGGLNQYAFVLDNPVNWIDPFGLKNSRYRKIRVWYHAVLEVVDSEGRSHQYDFAPVSQPRSLEEIWFQMWGMRVPGRWDTQDVDSEEYTAGDWSPLTGEEADEVVTILDSAVESGQGNYGYNFLYGNCYGAPDDVIDSVVRGGGRSRQPR